MPCCPCQITCELEKAFYLEKNLYVKKHMRQSGVCEGGITWLYLVFYLDTEARGSGQARQGQREDQEAGHPAVGPRRVRQN